MMDVPNKDRIAASFPKSAIHPFGVVKSLISFMVCAPSLVVAWFYNFDACIGPETNLDNLFIPVTRCIFSQPMPHARAYIVTLALFACLFADWLDMPLFCGVRYAAHVGPLVICRVAHA